jgi:hypothetical protein
MASYSSMVNTQSSDNQQEEFNATLPTESFSAEGFGLTTREERILAGRNDVAFVTLLYDDNETFQQLQQYEGIESDFRGRVFVQLMNESRTSRFAQYGFTEYPKGVVIGGSRSRDAARQIIQDPTEESIRSAVCNSFASWNPSNGPSVASVCSQ